MRQISIHSRHVGLLSTAAFLIFSVGCSGGRGVDVELAEVSGVVTIDGKPIPQIEVMFLPESDARPSRGMTNAEGKFTAYYPPDHSGAVPGRHKVSFNLKDANQNPDIVPRKYRSDKSGVAVDVVVGEPNEFTFDLKKK